MATERIIDFLRPVIITVTGGRDFEDVNFLEKSLDNWVRDYFSKVGPDDAAQRVFLVQGGAKGADTLARRWAEKRNHAVATIPALWDVYGHAAGHKRNEEMLKWFISDVVIAFKGGTGTADAVARAKILKRPLLDLREGQAPAAGFDDVDDLI